MATGLRGSGEKAATPTLVTGDVKVGTAKGGDVGEEEVKCGECRKMVGRSDKAVMCELCELWFHSKCEGLTEDTYRLMNQDKIHFYCGRCDKVAGKLLKTVVGLQARQTKMEGELTKVKNDVEDIKSKSYVTKEHLENALKHFDNELKEVKNVSLQGSEGNPTVTEVENLKTEWVMMKNDMTNQMNSTVKDMKDDVEESLEIERRRSNIIIHGLKDENATEDVDEVMDLFANGLKMDFHRHVDKMMRLGRQINQPTETKTVEDNAEEN
jgi:hypothetical protein